MEEKVEPKLGDAIPETWIKQAEKEIKSNYRTVILDEFRGKKDAEIHIHQLTSGIESKCADEYTKVFNRMLKDPDIMMKKQLEKVLQDRGVFGEEQENEIENKREEMRDIELTVAKIRKRGKFNKAQMNRYRTLWQEKKERISELYNEKSLLMASTVEGRAEEAEVKIKLSLCVKFSGGELVWESVDALNNDHERMAINRLIGDSLLFWAGLTQEIIDDLPTKLLFGGEETLDNSQED